MNAAQMTPMTEMTQERSAMDRKYQWNVEALYPSWEAWAQELDIWGREGSSPHWPELVPFRKTWNQSHENLKKLLELCFDIDRHLSKLYTYAHLRHDEDVAGDEAKKAHSRIMTLLYAFRQETAWIEPEVLQLSEEQLQALL